MSSLPYQRKLIGVLQDPARLINLIQDEDINLGQPLSLVFSPGTLAALGRIARPGESRGACLRRCIADDLARAGPTLGDPLLLSYAPPAEHATRQIGLPVSARMREGLFYRARLLRLPRWRYVAHVVHHADWLVGHGAEIPEDPEAILRAERVRY